MLMVGALKLPDPRYSPGHCDIEIIIVVLYNYCISTLYRLCTFTGYFLEITQKSSVVKLWLQQRTIMSNYCYSNLSVTD